MNNKFIKCNHKGNVIFVDYNAIEGVFSKTKSNAQPERSSREQTKIVTYNKNVFIVDETPDEIMELITKAGNPIIPKK